MIRRKRITVLGVSLLAALGLMSISAAGAQAGTWTIDGKALSENTNFQSEGGPVTIDGGATIKCTQQKGTGTLLAGGKAKTYLTLSGCAVMTAAGGKSEVCLIENEKIEFNGNTEMVLSKDGSQLVFANSKEFGLMGLISVNQECSLFGGEKMVVALDGEFTATVGSPAVKLPLSVSITKNSKFFVGLLGYSQLKYSSSMWLVGANAGKTLGTISS